MPEWHCDTAAAPILTAVQSAADQQQAGDDAVYPGADAPDSGATEVAALDGHQQHGALMNQHVSPDAS